MKETILKIFNPIMELIAYLTRKSYLIDTNIFVSSPEKILPLMKNKKNTFFIADFVLEEIHKMKATLFKNFTPAETPTPILFQPKEFSSPVKLNIISTTRYTNPSYDGKILNILKEHKLTLVSNDKILSLTADRPENKCSTRNFCFLSCL